MTGLAIFSGLRLLVGFLKEWTEALEEISVFQEFRYERTCQSDLRLTGSLFLERLHQSPLFLTNPGSVLPSRDYFRFTKSGFSGLLIPM